MAWPSGGPWLVVTTSRTASWEVAAAALAAAATSRVAVLRIVDPGQARSAPPAWLTHNLSVYAEARTGGTDGVRADDLVELVEALTRTHGLVLVGCDLGLLVPIGAGDFSVADVAWALQAPVVVVSDGAPDATHHTTLLLETLYGRDLTAAMIVLEGPADGPDGLDGLDLDAIPLAPAGRVPAGVTDEPDRFRAEATGWLDSMLHATRGRPARKPPAAPDAQHSSDDQPADDDQPAYDQDNHDGPAYDDPEHDGPDRDGPDRDGPDRDGPDRDGPDRDGRPTVSGRRVVLGLLGVFVALVLIVCAVAMYGPTATSPGFTSVTQEQIPEVWPSFAPAPPRLNPPPAHDACPPNAKGVAVTRPSKAVTARVNAAWQRIETWLAKHAPATRAALRKPASLAEIDAAQTGMSVRFPPELVASLLRHDGTSPVRGAFTFAPFYSLMSVRDIVRDRRGNCDVLTDLGWPGDEWWHDSFVPFAASGDGGNLIVEQRAGGHGRVGEFFAEDGTSFERWPASVAELLEGTATALETGKQFTGYAPRVDNNALDWGDE